jgi:sugar lactone lactonase YvrE
MNSSTKPLFNILIGILVVFQLESCKSQNIQSIDFTAENAFTSGIEGPAVDKEGNLYAVNFAENGTIGKVNEKGKGSVFVKLPGKSIGNGIRFDTEGNMYVADYIGHNVLQVKKGSEKVTVWAHNPDMSQPNDLAIAPNGTIYLSDPNWAESTGRIWMVNAAQEIILLEDGMGTTNGIEVSPDGKFLYVNESAQRNIWKYEIAENGTLTNKTKFIIFTDFGLDGMRCDEIGNLYVTRYDKGTVVVLSPEGKQIKEIRLKGKKPSNITFGGPDGKTCFVTMADRGAIEKFKADHAGAYFKSIH